MQRLECCGVNRLCERLASCVVWLTLVSLIRFPLTPLTHMPSSHPCPPAATEPRHAGAVAAFCEEIAAFATGIAKRCHERAAAAHAKQHR